MEKRDPDLMKFKVRHFDFHGMQWVQSTCSVILEPALLRIFFSNYVSFDDVIDKTELV